MTPRFQSITHLAYQELLRLRQPSLPVRNLSFYDALPGKTLLGGAMLKRQVLIVSYQDYAQKTGLTLYQLTRGGQYNDGYSMRELRPGLSLVLYDGNTYGPRQRYTVYHEVGHILCGHERHGPVEEIEAHFFASQYLMSSVFIDYCRLKGQEISPEFLATFFEVSRQAAEKKMEYLQSFPEDRNDLFYQLMEAYEKPLDERLKQMAREFSPKGGRQPKSRVNPAASFRRPTTFGEEDHRQLRQWEASFLDPPGR